MGYLYNMAVSYTHLVPLGIMIDKGVKSIGKSIKKEDPEEKMGVFCKKNGKVGVIELEKSFNYFSSLWLVS